jgi:hypothetical protein
MYQGGETGMQAYLGVFVDGQEVVVAPHGLRPRLDAGPADGLSNFIVIVIDLQRAETEFADVKRLLGELLFAFFAT